MAITRKGIDDFNTSSNVLDFSYATPSGTELIVVVASAIKYTGTLSFTGCVANYGGSNDNLTSIGAVNEVDFVSTWDASLAAWYWLLPDSGTIDYRITATSGANYVNAYIQAFSGIDTTTPIGDTATADLAADITVSIAKAGNWIIAGANNQYKDLYVWINATNDTVDSYGAAVNLNMARKVSSSTGNHTITYDYGDSMYVAFEIKQGGLSLLAENGAYALSGQTLAFLYDRIFAAAYGSYSLSGQTADLYTEQTPSILVESFDWSTSGADDTLTLTNSAASTSSAFIRNLSGGTRPGSSGPTGSTANTGPDYSIGLELTGVNQITARRGGSTGEVKTLGEVWRYNGAAGGDNEFIVRGRYALSLTGTSTSQAVSGVVNDDDCVPIITGVTTSDTSVSNWHGATVAAHMDGSGNVIVSRNNSAVSCTVYVTVVEFTGSNWSVGHGISSSHDSATETVTLNTDSTGAGGSTFDVGSWSNAMILAAGMEGDTVETGIADTLALVQPGASTTTVYFSVTDGDVGAANDGSAYIHVIVNSGMAVYRATDTNVTEGNGTYDTVSWPVGAPTDVDLDNLSLEWFTTSSGTGTAHLRGALGARITAASGTIQHWVHRSGNTVAAYYGVADLSGVVEPQLVVYTMSAAQGSYALSGQDAAFVRGLLIAALRGTYAMSGQTANVLAARLLGALHGTYTLTGQDAGALAARLLAAGQGGYTLAGQDAGALYDRIMGAANGEYTLTGIDAALLITRLIAASQGDYAMAGYTADLLTARLLSTTNDVYTLSGQDAGLTIGRVLAAINGNYAITGRDAILTADRLVSASQGTYTLTGQDATTLVDLLLSAAQGGYVLSGQDAGTLLNRLIAAAQGTYTLTGQDAATLATRIVNAAQGTYTLTGQDADLLLAARLIAASQGAYTLTGQDVALLASRLMSAAQGDYVLSGQDALLVYTTVGAYIITADYGIHALSGQDSNLLIDRFVSAAQGDYAATGQDTELLAGRLISAGHGVYALEGENASALIDRVLAAAPGAQTLSGQDATLLADRLLSAADGIYTISGQDAALIAARVLSSGTGVYVIDGYNVDFAWSGEVPILPPDERIYIVEYNNRYYIVREQSRQYAVAQQIRRATVSAQDRRHSVPAQDRTDTVH